MAAKTKRRRMGRPKGSGGPPELVRRHRVIVSLNAGELATLEAVADARNLPLGTAAYALLAPALRRARR
jgi:hypothetical protein